jgi:hypothetical protein
MSKVIYKYEVDTIVVMPDKAEILTVQLQNGSPWIWALVDTSEELVERNFNIVGTGWELEEFNHKYITTFQNGSYVWHVFEILGDEGSN